MSLSASHDTPEQLDSAEKLNEQLPEYTLDQLYKGVPGTLPNITERQGMLVGRCVEAIRELTARYLIKNTPDSLDLFLKLSNIRLICDNPTKFSNALHEFNGLNIDTASLLPFLQSKGLWIPTTDLLDKKSANEYYNKLNKFKILYDEYDRELIKYCHILDRVHKKMESDGSSEKAKDDLQTYREGVDHFREEILLWRDGLTKFPFNGNGSAPVKPERLELPDLPQLPEQAPSHVPEHPLVLYVNNTLSVHNDGLFFIRETGHKAKESAKHKLRAISGIAKGSGYKSLNATNIKDLNRITIIPADPDAAESFIEAITHSVSYDASKRSSCSNVAFSYFDSGWQSLASGYCDRKLRGVDNAIFEIKLEEGNQAEADKESHEIYDVIRRLNPGTKDLHPEVLSFTDILNFHQRYCKIMDRCAAKGNTYATSSVRDIMEFGVSDYAEYRLCRSQSDDDGMEKSLIAFETKIQKRISELWRLSRSIHIFASANEIDERWGALHFVTIERHNEGIVRAHRAEHLSPDEKDKLRGYIPADMLAPLRTEGIRAHYDAMKTLVNSLPHKSLGRQ